MFQGFGDAFALATRPVFQRGYDLATMSIKRCSNRDSPSFVESWLVLGVREHRPSPEQDLHQLISNPAVADFNTLSKLAGITWRQTRHTRL